MPSHHPARVCRRCTGRTCVRKLNLVSCARHQIAAHASLRGRWQEEGAHCEPFVFGPAFAMDSTPAPPCTASGRSEACRLQRQKEHSQKHGLGRRAAQERQAWPRVLELEVLVRKLVSVNGLAAGAIASREVPTLFAASAYSKRTQKKQSANEGGNGSRWAVCIASQVLPGT